jgi:hypothetical protein
MPHYCKIDSSSLSQVKNLRQTLTDYERARDKYMFTCIMRPLTIGSARPPCTCSHLDRRFEPQPELHLRSPQLKGA